MIQVCSDIQIPPQLNPITYYFCLRSPEPCGDTRLFFQTQDMEWQIRKNLGRNFGGSFCTLNEARITMPENFAEKFALFLPRLSPDSLRSVAEIPHWGRHVRRNTSYLFKPLIKTPVWLGIPSHHMETPLLTQTRPEEEGEHWKLGPCSGRGWPVAGQKCWASDCAQPISQEFALYRCIRNYYPINSKTRPPFTGVLRGPGLKVLHGVLFEQFWASASECPGALL